VNVNLLFKSLKEIRISWPIYTAGMVLYVYLLMSIFPSIQRESEQFQRLLESYPEGLFEFFGGGISNIATIEGYLSLELFSLMWFIIIGAFVIGYGTGTIGKEFDNGTIEILFSQPITRTRALVTKSMVLFGSTIAIVTLTMASTYLFASAFDVDIKAEGVAALAIIGTLFFLAIGSISLFFSVLLGQRGRAALLSSSLVFGSYLLTVLSELADWSDRLDAVSLFNYYDSAKLLSSGDVPLDALLLYAGTIIVFYIGSIFVFNRRDIAP